MGKEYHAHALGIVIPVYGQRGALPQVLDALYTFARDTCLHCHVVLVEDGGGTDSREALRALAAARTGVTAVLLSRNTGQQHALYVGIQHLPPACDRVVTMDDDGAHPVSLLPEMLAKLDSGAELCFATPVRRQGPLMRKGGAALRDALFHLCLGARGGLRVGAYRAMSATLARRLQPEPDGFFYLSAAALRLHPRAVSIGYTPGETRQSTYTLNKLVRLCTALLVHYTPPGRLLPGRRRPAEAAFEVVAGRGWLWQP